MGREIAQKLREVMLERARVFAPLIVVVQMVALVVGGRAQIAIHTPVIISNLALDIALGTLGVLLWRRSIGLQHAHAVVSMLWWSPVACTLISFAQTQNEHLVGLLLLESATGVVMLSSNWLVVSFVALDCAWLTIALSIGSANVVFQAAALFVAQAFAFVLQRMQLATMIRSEEHRLAAVKQLDELRASEAARIDLAEQLEHSQRLDAIGTLAAGLAHDMNNVLAAIMGLADELAHEAADETHRADLEQIVREADRGAELTRGLLTFSRRGQYRRQTITVGEIIDDAVTLLSRTLPKSVELDKEVLEPAVCIEGDPTQFSQAIVNLGINAADAMSGKGVLRILGDVIELNRMDAATLRLAPGRFVRIRVIDTGAGMDDPTRARLFEPFFTTKPSGKGTGLGLALVWGVVTKSGGTVSVDSQLGRGSTFSIYLPVTTGQPRPRLSSSNLNRPVTGGVVLVVDDEPGVRASTTRMLVHLGLRVIAAADGQEGLRMFEEHGNEINLVLLDMGMPGMSGSEMFAALRARSQVRVVVVTGYALEEEVQDLVGRGARLLEKPFRLESLEQEVDRALGRLKNLTPLRSSLDTP